MDGKITLRSGERKALLWELRKGSHPEVRLRAHILLLLAAGYPWSVISAVLFCSSATIARWKRRFEQEGLDGVRSERRGRRTLFALHYAQLVIRWVTEHTPSDFGFLRSRWCCATLVCLLVQVHHVQVSRETIRRWLHREDLVWRRPRPVLRPRDPRRAEKMRKLRELLANLGADEVAVFEDEVDLNTNPKIGAMWMRRGAQAEVETPGTNEKRYRAGSLNWRSGDVILTEGLPREGRSSALFLRHLDDLRYRLRRYRVIHVICDNASFHRSGAVRSYLAKWADRIVLHFLPTHAPEANPIERLWWHLHEEITRNHRCRTMDELLDLVFSWLDARTPFQVERHAYVARPAA
jgi:putative transposase